MVTKYVMPETDADHNFADFSVTGPEPVTYGGTHGELRIGGGMTWNNIDITLAGSVESVAVRNTHGSYPYFFGPSLGMRLAL